nr:MAG TPA: S-Ribosylhomocysteinase (LuxS) [Caudoviricetes sp.]
MFTVRDELNLTRDLLITLGMKTTDDGSLVYSETGGPVVCDNMNIKLNTLENPGVYVSKHDIKLEILNPACIKLMEMLFATFLRDEEEYGNIPEVQLFYFDRLKSVEDDVPDKSRMTIKYSNGVKWEGNAFYNKMLTYIEAMFVIDGAFSDRDLRMFDTVVSSALD